MEPPQKVCQQKHRCLKFQSKEVDHLKEHKKLIAKISMPTSPKKIRENNLRTWKSVNNEVIPQRENHEPSPQRNSRVLKLDNRCILRHLGISIETHWVKSKEMRNNRIQTNFDENIVSKRKESGGIHSDKINSVGKSLESSLEKLTGVGRGARLKPSEHYLNELISKKQKLLEKTQIEALVKPRGRGRGLLIRNNSKATFSGSKLNKLPVTIRGFFFTSRTSRPRYTFSS